MSQFKIGKASSQFHKAASDLQCVVLINKAHQETRFVMATLRGLATYMRNLPCLHHIHNCSLQKFIEESDNTSAKELQSILKDLANGENISMMIGLCQLFELYSKRSLTVQHSRKFPTSILEELISLLINYIILAKNGHGKKSSCNLLVLEFLLI